MLQILLIVVAVNPMGERKTTAAERDDLASCFEEARNIMESAEVDFDKMNLRSVTAGCLVRVKPTPS